ncbi:MAG TPA: rhomboid family intramembrane serine protease [Holophagaceae bacterium]|nr:rhomboid family intramembrane serine protease [Holophagaceae bacterium]
MRRVLAAKPVPCSHRLMAAEPSDLPTPWLDPGLLPEATQGGWAWISHGVAHPMDLDALLAEIRLDPDRPSPPRKNLFFSPPPPPMVTLVEAPGRPRILPVSEVPELQAAMLARDELILRRNLRTGLPTLLLVGALLAIGITVGTHLAYLVILALVFLQQLGPVLDGARLLRQVRRRPGAYLAQHARELRFQIWMSRAGLAPVRRTWTLAGTWAVLFLLQIVAGPESSILAAGLVKAKVAAEPWRLLTGAMLHGSMLHILMNGLATLVLGKLVERVASRHLVVPIWLLGALCGSLASWALLPATSIGASGGLMALLGFLAVLGWRRRQLLPPDFGAAMARSLVLMGVLGILAWKLVDNAGHGGGLLAGVFAGLWVLRDPATPLPLPERPGLAALGGAAMAIFLLLAAWTAWKVLGF